MAHKHPHEGLKAWEDSMSFVAECYKTTSTFPQDQRFSLVSQIQRAAVSVPVNIAEGSARMSPADTKHFYVVARGSLMELDTLLILAAEFGFVSRSKLAAMREQIVSLSKMINGLIGHQTRRAEAQKGKGP